MTEVDLLEKDYREAFLYLASKIKLAEACLENKMPWVPQDQKNFERSLQIFKSWHSDPVETIALDSLKPELRDIVVNNPLSRN